MIQRPENLWLQGATWKQRLVKRLYTAFPMLRFSSFRTYPSLLFQVDHEAETASAVCTFPTKKLRFFPLTSASTEHTFVVVLPKHVVGRQGQPLLVGALWFWKIRGRQHTVWAFHRDQLILPVDFLFPPINPPNILEIGVSQNEDQFTDIFNSLHYTHATGKKIFHQTPSVKIWI